MNRSVEQHAIIWAPRFVNELSLIEQRYLNLDTITRDVRLQLLSIISLFNTAAFGGINITEFICNIEETFLLHRLLLIVRPEFLVPQEQLELHKTKTRDLLGVYVADYLKQEI